MADRQCGTCQECCICPKIDQQTMLLQIGTYEAKPAYTPCRHLSGDGCSVYSNRPQTCRDFECAWLKGAVGDAEARPDRIGLLPMVQHSEAGVCRLTIMECRENAFAERGFALAEELMQSIPNVDHIHVVFYRSSQRLRYSPQWDFVLVSEGTISRRFRCSPREAVQIIKKIPHCAGGVIQIGAGIYSERALTMAAAL